MVDRRNSYLFLILSFLAGILAGTLISILYAEPLYALIVRYLPVLHMEAEKRNYGVAYGRYVFLLRLPVWCVLTTAVFTGFYLPVFCCLAFLAGTGVSVLIVAATMLQNMLGLIDALAVLLPHSLFYLFAFWALYELAGKKAMFTLGEQIRIAAKIASFWIIGILLETLVSPVMICRLLRTA